MVSTRSHSVLSAGAAADTAATAGEVNSAAPTPRRSGRLRTSGGTTPSAAPRSTRAAKTRRQLEAVEEVEEQQEQQQQQQQEQAAEQQGPEPQLSAENQQEQQGEKDDGEAEKPPQTLSRSARRRSNAAAAAAKKQEAAAAGAQEEEGSGGRGADEAAGVALKADAAMVDVLAEQMFAALAELTELQQGSSGSGTESESDAEKDGAAGEGAKQAAEQQQQQGDEADSSSEEDSDSEDDAMGGAGDSVPAHLRWQPELTLPGPQAGGSGSGAAAARGAAAAAAAAGVHVVRRGKDGLHVPAPDEKARGKAARKERPDTAGKGWFDLPATQITDEVKNDLRMLRLRGALDPKAHYKKLDETKFPKYFQMGTVVEGAADFYSARLTNKQRKRTFTDEIMADPHLAEVRKKRYTKMQEERSYWSRKPAKKTSNERRKKPHHRPKH